MYQLGHLSLFLCLTWSVIQILYCIYTVLYQKGYTTSKQSSHCIGITPNVCFLLVNISIFSLAGSFLQSDFSNLNVLQNSHSTQPLIYKISALWGNHEGSMLLWCWILNLYIFLLFRGMKVYINPTSSLFFKMVFSSSYINTFFLSFTFFTSNPFLQTPFFSQDGSEMNPILQDPGLIVHPPLLYFGYIGFSLVYIMLISLMTQKNTFPKFYALQLKKWTRVSWIFLTLGITLGSWWAYHELGWGGWWFWDPVENASLMPWLVGTALLHSTSVLDKQKSMSYWTVVLGVGSFLLSLLGTFFVRSGLLSSVHSFATDSTRGVFILFFIISIVILSFYMFYYRNPKLFYRIEDDAFTKRGGVVVQNILLVVMTIAILVGTFSPVVFNLVFSRDISIGPPFYNHLILPMLIPFTVLMILSPFLPYSSYKKNAVLYRLVKQEFWIGVLISIFILTFNYFYNISLMNTLFLVLSILVVISLFSPSISIRNRWPMVISHLGFSVAVGSIAVSNSLFEESIQVIRPGDQVKLGKHLFIFRGTNYLKGPNYHSLYGDFIVTNTEKKSITTVLYPEKRFYFIQGIFSTKASIHTNLFADVYAVIGDGSIEKGWYTRFYHNPGIPYLWLGGILMATGSALSLIKKTPRSYLKRIYHDSNMEPIPPKGIALSN